MAVVVASACYVGGEQDDKLGDGVRVALFTFT